MTNSINKSVLSTSAALSINSVEGSAHSTRTSLRTYILFLFPLLCLVTSCEPKQQILSEGDYITPGDTNGLLHRKEYLFHDSFFVEETKNGIRHTLTQCKTEEQFRDSTFSQIFYFNNGVPKASRNFLHGDQSGLWKSWYEDGQQKSASMVDKGVLRDYFSYYDNGSIAVSASRQPDGVMSRTERWRNGNLKEEFISDSLGNGRCTNYHENGKKSQSGGLILFAPFDTWQRWDSLGNQLSDTIYGKPVTH